MSLDNTKKINRVVVNGEDMDVVGVPTLQEKSVTPTTSSQRVIADTGYDGLSGVNVEAVTSSVDENIIPTNIRRGTTILGVQGNLDADKPDQSKTVTPTTSQQNIVADTGYELAQVTVNAVTSDIDANIQEGNIKEGVTILGKTGTFKGGITPSGTIEITENNKTYDVTNYASANVNVPSQTPNLVTKEITENGTYNASDDGADGYSSVTVNVTGSGGGGGGLSFDPVFANNTPAQIAQVSALISYNNMTSAQVEATYGWKIGDTISYQLTTGENVEMRIIGFNHDDKSDGSGKAGITLDMTHCLATHYPMNSTATNAGGYPASEMRNTTLPIIKATIPQEWRDVIKTVNKKSANGGQSNFSEVLTTSEELFLLSELELGVSSSPYAQNFADEGSKYPYYNGRNRKKAKGIDGTITNWWSRSSDKAGTTTFVATTTTAQSYGSNPTLSFGVSFAFCI